MKKKKKGIWAMEFTGKLILALVITGIGILIIKELAAGTGYDKQLCKLSVIANAKGRIAGTELYNLKCPVRYITIEQDKYIEETKDTKDEFKLKEDSLNKDKERFFKVINRRIANLIFDCWDQFAAGQLSVFSQYYEDRQCLICARIEFNQDVINLLGEGYYSGNQGEEYSLQEYMVTKNPFQHEITYYEFALDQLDAYKRPLYEYNINEPMAVVFTAMNEHKAKDYAKKAWEGVKDIDLKLIGIQFNILHDEKAEGKEYKFINTLDFVPYSEVAAQCDALR